MLQLLRVLVARPNKEYLTRVAALVSSGAVRTSIERSCSLDQVPEALGHLGADRALGKPVIEIG